MTDIDRLLRDYGQRWRAAQPPTLHPARAGMLARTAAVALARSHRRRRLVASLAAAVAVLLVGAGVALWPRTGNPTPTGSPTPTVSWSPPPDAIPFADLPPLAGPLPLLSRPDPATDGADALPACTAAQVSAQSSADARRILFLPVGDARCRLRGAPTITPLGPDGQPVAVPTHPRDSYGGPVAVNFENPPLLTLSWDGWDCAGSVEIASIRVTLPEDGGSLTVPGLGTSQCTDHPGPDPEPIDYAGFGPADDPRYVSYTGTAARGMRVTINAPDAVVAEPTLEFTVTLTAGDFDVPLEPCLNYSLSVGLLNSAGLPPVDGSVLVGELNCAAVPSRDDEGNPVLRARTSLTFVMRSPTPANPGSARIDWSTQNTYPDQIEASRPITIT